MMTAIVSLKIEGEICPKMCGDVLSVGPVSRPIGSMEWKRFLICEIDDPDVELLIGEDFIVHNPYASVVEDTDPAFMRSEKYVDVEALDAALKTRLFDPDDPVELVEWATIQPAWKDRTV